MAATDGLKGFVYNVTVDVLAATTNAVTHHGLHLVGYLLNQPIVIKYGTEAAIAIVVVYLLHNVRQTVSRAAAWGYFILWTLLYYGGGTLAITWAIMDLLERWQQHQRAPLPPLS